MIRFTSSHSESSSRSRVCSGSFEAGPSSSPPPGSSSGACPPPAAPSWSSASRSARARRSTRSSASGSHTWRSASPRGRWRRARGGGGANARGAQARRRRPRHAGQRAPGASLTFRRRSSGSPPPTPRWRRPPSGRTTAAPTTSSGTVEIAGEFAYGFLKGETGVPRLVRISPFDASRRRQTSFASASVVPEVDDVEVSVREDEIRVDVFRSSGPGGQGVNTADSAVRITHLPTGIVVQCQNERSQLRNRDTAMRILKARLYGLAHQKQREELAELTGEKKEIAFGSQIRSYTFHPYQLIKDHRTGLEIGNVEGVMDGDLDGLIRAYLLWARGREA